MDKELLKLLGKQHRGKIKGIGSDPNMGAEHAAPPSFEDRFGSDPDFGREHHASYLSIRRRLRDHEGFVTHMYRGSSDKGWVTVGIGFLLDTESKLSEFIWHDRATRRSVAKSVVIEEWKYVKSQSRGFSAPWYKKFTNLDIQDIKINLALESKLRRLHSDLRRQFRNRLGIIFDELPASVQEAFFDMGWTSGAGFLSKKVTKEDGSVDFAWPELRKALFAGNWEIAADHSRRGKVSPVRNLEIHGLFMRAIAEPAPRIHEFGDEPE